MQITTEEITESTLLNEAVAFVKTQKGRYGRMAADTGLSQRFITDLAQGISKDPGVRKIEKLLRYKLQLGEALLSTTLR